MAVFIGRAKYSIGIVRYRTIHIICPALYCFNEATFANVIGGALRVDFALTIFLYFKFTYCMLFVFMKCMYSCTIFIYAKAFVYVRHL